MIPLTQTEFAIACIIAGVLLLMVKHWRVVLTIWFIFWFANWSRREQWRNEWRDDE